MTRSPRALGLITALLLVALPLPSNAMSMRFGGANDGGIVWDGGGDAGTMNNNCGALGLLCDTNGLILSDVDQILANLTVREDGYIFSRFDLSLVLSLPSTPSAAVTNACTSELGAGACGNLTPTFLQNHNLGLAKNLQDAISVPDETAWAAVLPFASSITALTPLTLNIGDVSPFYLTDASKDFLRAAGVLDALGAAHAGLSLSFDLETQNEFRRLGFDVEGQPAAVAAVPEPASMLLLGSGLAGMVARRYRRRHTAAQS
jgi:hypothetical protein